MDGLLDRHRPTFHPRRQARSIAESSAREFEGLLQPALLAGQERNAQLLAQRGGGTCQVQQLLSVRLRCGTDGETFERPRDTAFAAQFLEQRDAFGIQLDDRRGVAVALNALAVNARDRGELAASSQLFEQCLGIWKDLGDPPNIARALSNLASVMKLQGEL
jgi:hypothetical protein